MALYLVSACPGSGKTERIINEIKKLLDAKVHPDEIMALTFTRYAAQSMINRLGPTTAFINFGTFHKVSRELLKTSGYLQTSEPFHIDEYQFHFYDILREATSLRSEKQATHPLVKLLRHVNYLFVDEFQDVNQVQYNIVYLLSKFFAKKTWVVGDENQNIYRFRGSDSKFMTCCVREFAMWAEVHRDTFEVNHRSTPAIVDLLNAIESQIHVLQKQRSIDSDMKCKVVKSGRRDLDINPKPILRYYMSYQRANQDIANRIQVLRQQGVPLSAICVLSRSSHPLYALKDNLDDMDIPGEIWAAASENQGRSRETADKVTLSTIHSAKGGEFQHVFIQTHNSFFPDRRSDIIDEWKLWYVAVSRCATHLTVYDHFQHSSEFLSQATGLFDIDTKSLETFAHISRFSNQRCKKNPNPSPVLWSQIASRMDGGMFRFIKQNFLPTLDIFTQSSADVKLPSKLEPEASLLHFYIGLHVWFKLTTMTEDVVRCLGKRGSSSIPNWENIRQISKKDSLANVRHAHPFQEKATANIEIYLDRLYLQVSTFLRKGDFTSLNFPGHPVLIHERLCLVSNAKEKAYLYPVVDPNHEFKISLLDLLKALYMALLYKGIAKILLFHLESLTVSEIDIEAWDRTRQAEFVTFFNQFFIKDIV